MNALERGIELATTKGASVPLLATRYRRALCMRVGMCGEVCITAFAWYAEKEEGLPPSGDDLYDFPGHNIAQEVVREANDTTWKPEWWDDDIHPIPVETKS